MAHVDAGKTSLTERLLHAAGVIDDIGSVDHGSTRTDTLAMERRRGITIRSAVVSFVVDDLVVNLIDTPGHPDFIAEVERVLAVLDGAVLVISAVEGVQAQTRLLYRALQRLAIPTLMFVNKIDRAGADEAAVLRGIESRLTSASVAMGSVHRVGTGTATVVPYDGGSDDFVDPLAERLAEHDDDILTSYLDDPGALTFERLDPVLATQTSRALVHPVLFGSAITGTGIEPLLDAITRYLPTTPTRTGGALSGTVFKIERGPAGEKLAYVRIFSGALRTRDRLLLRDHERRVTAIEIFDAGKVVSATSLPAGRIGRVRGLGDVRIGDVIGGPPSDDVRALRFAPPSLEAVVVARHERDRGALHTSLAQLAEQDPLIGLRQDDVRREFAVTLYGEVQKEVIRDTLADDFGLEVRFRETTTICVERPVGSGTAIETLGDAGNPFLATVGFRVDPGPSGSGIDVRLDARLSSIPLFVYGTVEAFGEAITRTVEETLQEGLHGWQVTDCTVTLTDSGYTSPASSARDFRKLIPLVLMAALARAGTAVCEPIHRFEIELPADALGLLLPALARSGATPRGTDVRGSWCTVAGEIAAARLRDLQRALPGASHGEGILESALERYEPVHGRPAPRRPRTDANPLDREEYLLHVQRRM